MCVCVYTNIDIPYHIPIPGWSHPQLRQGLPIPFLKQLAESQRCRSTDKAAAHAPTRGATFCAVVEVNPREIWIWGSSSWIIWMCLKCLKCLSKFPIKYVQSLNRMPSIPWLYQHQPSWKSWGLTGCHLTQLLPSQNSGVLMHGQQKWNQCW